MFPFTKFTLARQFILVSFFIFLAKTIIVGSWAGQQIEIREMSQVATSAALNVGSLVTPSMQDSTLTGQLEPEQISALEHFATQVPFSQQLVGLTLWGPDGVMLYSNNKPFIKQQLRPNARVTQAFTGQASAEIIEIDALNNPAGIVPGTELVKSYVPLLAADTGLPIAVLEVLQKAEQIIPGLRAAQRQRWLGVGLTMLGIFLFLAAFVTWSSRTMAAQQQDLKTNICKLRKLLHQNKHLHDRVRGAAGRATALNEKFLARISADLHDGPGQDLALALLRMESIIKYCPNSLSADVYTVQTAIESALTELRTISAGLRLPQINSLSPVETAHRAIRDYQRKTNCPVELEVGDVPAAMPVPVKITLYRIVQEALSNGYRHAAGAGQMVRLDRGTCDLHLEVVDTGPGFNPAAVPTHNGRLGLVGMSDRVKALGGQFEVKSIYGQGTTVSACLPLVIPEGDHV